MAAGDDVLRPNPTTAFARDLKRAGKRGKDLDKLREVIDALCRGRPLEARHQDHALKGEWKGSRDCHVEPDWVLIYRVDAEAGELILVRTGTHADLFNK